MLTTTFSQQNFFSSLSLKKYLNYIVYIYVTNVRITLVSPKDGTRPAWPSLKKYGATRARSLGLGSGRFFFFFGKGTTRYGTTNHIKMSEIRLKHEGLTRRHVGLGRVRATLLKLLVWHGPDWAGPIQAHRLCMKHHPWPS